MLRNTGKQTMRLSQRAIATSASKPADASNMAAEQREVNYPKLGNRDIVGFGFNGHPTYSDRAEFPMPAVRFKENSPEVLALRQKETGDWSKLSIDEKKELYRNSFRLTYAEMAAPTGEWKSVLAGYCVVLSLAFMIMTLIKKIAIPEAEVSLTKEWQKAQLERMIRHRQNPITGPASKWDYEKNQWK